MYGGDIMKCHIIFGLIRNAGGEKEWIYLEKELIYLEKE